MLPLLIADVLELAVARAEDAIAESHERRVTTYGELDAYSSALAFALERRGVVAGDRVATLLSGIEALVAFWAIAKAGAVGVALAGDDAEELAASLREIDARALVVDARILPTFHHAVARAPRLRAVIVRGRDADSDATGSATYVSYETALAEEDPLSRPSPRRVDLDDAWLERELGGPRSALSHRVLLSRAGSLVRGLDLNANDSISGHAFTELAIACALAGACFRVPGGDPREPAAARTLWICADDDEQDDDDAEPGATTLVLYRSMACGPIARVAESNDPAHLMPNVDVRVLDDTGAAVGAKVVGEIAVRSSNLSADAASAAKDGYFRTGDSGMLDDAGALYVL